MSILTQEISDHWFFLSPMFRIRTIEEYDTAIECLNALIDEVGTDETHPLYELLDLLGDRVYRYEERHEEMPAVPPAEMLHHFMDEWGLRQSELPEIGSQGVISEILHGKRELNIRQIRILAKQFNVSPAVFI